MFKSMRALLLRALLLLCSSITAYTPLPSAATCNSLAFPLAYLLVAGLDFAHLYQLFCAASLCVTVLPLCPALDAAVCGLLSSAWCMCVWCSPLIFSAVHSPRISPLPWLTFHACLSPQTILCTVCTALLYAAACGLMSSARRLYVRLIPLLYSEAYSYISPLAWLAFHSAVSLQMIHRAIDSTLYEISMLPETAYASLITALLCATASLCAALLYTIVVPFISLLIAAAAGIVSWAWRIPGRRSCRSPCINSILKPVALTTFTFFPEVKRRGLAQYCPEYVAMATAAAIAIDVVLTPPAVAGYCITVALELASVTYEFPWTFLFSAQFGDFSSIPPARQHRQFQRHCKQTQPHIPPWPSSSSSSSSQPLSSEDDLSPQGGVIESAVRALLRAARVAAVAVAAAVDRWTLLGCELLALIFDMPWNPIFPASVPEPAPSPSPPSHSEETQPSPPSSSSQPLSSEDDMSPQGGVIESTFRALMRAARVAAAAAYCWAYVLYEMLEDTFDMPWKPWFPTAASTEPPTSPAPVRRIPKAAKQHKQCQHQPPPPCCPTSLSKTSPTCTCHLTKAAHPPFVMAWDRPPPTFASLGHVSYPAPPPPSQPPPTRSLAASTPSTPHLPPPFPTSPALKKDSSIIHSQMVSRTR